MKDHNEVNRPGPGTSTGYQWNCIVALTGIPCRDMFILSYLLNPSRACEWMWLDSFSQTVQINTSHDRCALQSRRCSLYFFGAHSIRLSFISRLPVIFQIKWTSEQNSTPTFEDREFTNKKVVRRQGDVVSKRQDEHFRAAEPHS